MYISRNSLEQIGSRVTQTYMGLPSLIGQPIQRIEPERLAREVCGLSLDFCHLSGDRSILGMTSFGEADVEVSDDERGPFFYHMDGRTILVESDLASCEEQRGRYHFTVLHETAHQILRALFPTTYASVCCRVHYCLACRQREKRDWEEWQADALASALLLPADLVYKTALDFDLEKGIKTLNRVFFPSEYARFSAMARQLGASKQALAIRMKQLGLLEREYLKAPYALADVVKEADEE